MNKKLFSLFLIILALSAKAQFVVTPGGGAASVASAIGGTGVTISNITINCNAQSYGSFSGGTSSGMGMGTGLALTTGKLSALPGTGNSNDDYSYCVGTNFSDPQLTALSSSATYDACIIQFDVVPQCTSMGITFVFGSDEYTNWVNATYNDAFGFFVTGPNPGGGSYTNQNIAVIPSGVNVSVDNVNNVDNPSYFINNNSGTYANHFDGFTTVLTPSIAVTPCATYHVKLAIADATDCQMDSGVLINVLQCNNVTTLSTTNTPATACGVNDGTASVNVTNGLPPLTYTWSPAPGGGQGTPNATGLTAGTTYTVTVDDNYACILPVTATVTIGGPVAPTVAVSSLSVCSGTPATVTATTGTGGGTYSWSPGGATTSSISVNPTTTTTYTCSYTLSGCTGTSTGTVTVNPQPTVTPVAPVCSGVAPFNLSADVTGGGWSGTGITNASAGTFSPATASTGTNVITYSAIGGCTDTIHIEVIPGAIPTWTQPTPMCVIDAPIDLSTLITGTTGGTFTGTGVTGSTFSPAGLSGSIPVTYTVGSSPCVATSTLNISVSPNVPPVITAVAPVCSDAGAFTLNASIPGGTWTGTGVSSASAGTFDPSTASTSTPNQVIYTTSGSCTASDTIQVIVNPASSAAWTAPAPMCASNSAINLDSLITGTTGGTWAGTGVTGHVFNPAGLSGNIAITYGVGTSCADTVIQNISVIPSASPAWTTTTLCASGAAISLDTLVTGTAGGTWSGTGVTGSTFDPAGLSGPVAVTYTVGSSPCVATSIQNINVITTPNPAWTGTSVCSNAAVVNLNSLVTGTPGGTWSGTGVTGSTFNPAGLSGPVSITYTVGASGCSANSAQTITVTPSADATITSVSPLCVNGTPITLSAATNGGTWSGAGITNPTTGAFNPAATTAGPHIITYSISGSCGAVDTVVVNVLPLPSAAWVMQDTICNTASPLNLGTMVSGTSGGTFSGTGVSGNTFDPTGLSGNVTVTYTVTQAGCTSSSTQVIDVDNVTASFTASPTSGMAPLVVNTINGSSNAVSYSWNFGNGQTSTATDPTITYPNNGNFPLTLTATSEGGCVDIAQVIIHVDETSALVIPNIFTPNGDGSNDVFYPVVEKGLSNFKAVVYDRWGLKMHEWDDANGGWDGKSKSGALAPDGTYYYIITGKGVDGKDYNFTGFVQLFTQK